MVLVVEQVVVRGIELQSVRNLLFGQDGSGPGPGRGRAGPGPGRPGADGAERGWALVS